MRLLRLYIVDSGVFDKTLIDFTNDGQPQDLICLSGVNGTGKTTIMDLVSNLIALLSNKLNPLLGFNSQKPNILTLTEFAQLDILIKGKVFSIVFGDKRYIQKDKNNKQTLLIDKEVKDIYIKIEKSLKLERNSNYNLINVLADDNNSLVFRSEYSGRNKQFKNEEILSKLFDNIKNKVSKQVNRDDLSYLPLLYYFTTIERQILDINYSNIPKYQFEYNIAHTYDPKKEDLNGLFVYYDYAYPKEFENLKKWINNSVLTDKKLERIDRPEFKTLIKTKDGAEHGLELLSSGEKNLLIIAVQLYLKASQNTVFLIDEIDNNLHPEFQEKLMKIVKDIQKRFDCQIIASSHSRYIWNHFKDEQIIRLTELIK